MRSIKGIIIGFLLILLGFAVTSYSLIAGGVLAAAGLAAVVIFALPKKTQQPQAEQPPAPAPEPEDPAPELRPEALPDILTDPPAQKKPEPPPAADAQTLFGTLAEAYTRIDELTCRGPAWMLERDIRLCRAFCERWEAAVKDPVFASFVRAKARYADYTDEFLLPGFGKRGRIHGRRTSGELLDDLTAAVKKRASRQESALQSALRAEQWFESICRQLRRVQPAVQEGAAGEAVQGPLPQPSTLRADTPLQTLDTFCVLALKTTGKHPGRDELVQLSALKFRRFAPETILTVSIRPEKGLTRYAREAGVTDSMVASAPAAAEVAASIEAFLGERAPLVLFQSEELAFLPAAGIGCAGEGRTVYDVQSLLGKPDGKAPTLAEACRDLFSFTPELGGTEQEALACGLVFCALCDRTLHLTKKSAARYICCKTRPNCGSGGFLQWKFSMDSAMIGTGTQLYTRV